MMKLTKRESVIYELGMAQGVQKGFNMALELQQQEIISSPNAETKATDLPVHLSMQHPDTVAE